MRPSHAGAIGIQRQRALVVGDRLVEPLGLAIDQAAVGERLTVIGIEADGLVEIGKRLFGLSACANTEPRTL